MRRLKAGIIGLGVGEQHIAGYRRHPHCDVVALCDLLPEKQAQASERYPDARILADAEALLSDPQIDVVSIASFDDAHHAQVVRALDSGKHVFVEKPLCQSHEQLRDIKRAWSRHGGRLKLHCNLVLRAAPLYVWLREQFQKGLLGELYSFDGDYLYGRLHKITEGWRNTVEGYSVMQGGGVHLVDLLLWLTGQRPQRVVAVGNRICSRGTAFRYHDYVTATLTFPSGLVARVSANFGCVHRHHHVVRLFGTEATFLYDDAGARLHLSRDPHARGEPVDHAALPASKGELIPEFVQAILDDEDWAAETQRHFDVLSVCIACDEALRCQLSQDVCYV